MAHRTLSRRTVTAGMAVALLLAGLMAAALAGERPAAADEHDDGGLGGAVGDVVDGVADDEEEDGGQEAADGGETQEVQPESGGGDGGQEPAPQEAPAEQAPAEEAPGGGGGEEPAADQSADQSGGSAPVPSGPRTAAGPRLNPSAGLPEGEAAGATFDFSATGDGFASAPEVFTEDGSRRARRPDELALSSLPRENGPANAEPTGDLPTELVAAATGLLVTVGVGHLLYATRHVDDELLDDGEPSDEADGDGNGDGDGDNAGDAVEDQDEA